MISRDAGGWLEPPDPDMFEDTRECQDCEGTGRDEDGDKCYNCKGVGHFVIELTAYEMAYDAAIERWERD